MSRDERNYPTRTETVQVREFDGRVGNYPFTGGTDLAEPQTGRLEALGELVEGVRADRYIWRPGDGRVDTRPQFLQKPAVLAAIYQESAPEPIFEGYEGLKDKIYDADGKEADIWPFGGAWIRSPTYEPRPLPKLDAPIGRSHEQETKARLRRCAGRSSAWLGLDELVAGLTRGQRIVVISTGRTLVAR